MIDTLRELMKLRTRWKWVLPYTGSNFKKHIKLGILYISDVDVFFVNSEIKGRIVCLYSIYRKATLDRLNPVRYQAKS